MLGIKIQGSLKLSNYAVTEEISYSCSPVKGKRIAEC